VIATVNLKIFDSDLAKKNRNSINRQKKTLLKSRCIEEKNIDFWCIDKHRSSLSCYDNRA